MILAEECSDREGGKDCQRPQHILAIGEAATHRRKQPEPVGGDDGHDREGQQTHDELLRLDRQQRDRVYGGKHERGNARPHRRPRLWLGSGHALKPAR